MSSPASSLLSSNPGSGGGKQSKVVAGYALQQRLGSGSFATVYKGVKLPPAEGQNATEAVETVAIKAITRTSEKLTKKVLENLDIEISILRTYRHPNIVCLHDVQKTERHFYLILEYCAGGDVQKLIRTRKAGRLSEGLTRRLMRDLAAGLGFLWGQELIHRDIKPQNLLLTGPLPIDELDDPEKTPELEERRRNINFPSADFCLKIADFGFARHLQTTSLAETLCGSPLYMAPEILQHHRYDAKADLWSVGTVLFEMISGRPPFHGENHIDLLRNIQRKAVRLPPDVRVSKECVNLLRILLNRNPLSRAGFKEFFDACEAFVSLGCQGATKQEGKPWEKRAIMDLGTIQEYDDQNPGTASMITVATATQTTPSHNQTQQQVGIDMQGVASTNTTVPGFVTPPFGPMATPVHLVSNYPEKSITVRSSDGSRPYSVLQPLQSSPPVPDVAIMATRMPGLPVFDNRAHSYQLGDTGRRIDSSQNSTDESGFVIVELGTGQRNDVQSLSTSGTELVDLNRNRDGRALEPSPPTSPIYNVMTNPVVTSRGDYMVVNDPVNRRLTKGMLSTSPGTGGALMGLVGGRARSLYEAVGGTMTSNRLEGQIESLTKLLAASEDVGRRAVSVAHLGDARAYLAIRCIAMNEEGASLVSSSPMDGVEEEHERSSGEVTDDTSSTEVMGQVRRRSSSATMTDAKIEDDDEAEEMPFAVSPESPSSKISSGMPSRAGHSFVYGKGNISSRSVVKTGPSVIRSHFGEAISCYLKALAMLKGALGGVQNLTKDLDVVSAQRALSNPQRQHIQKLQKRKEVTINWLSGQFRGVLERADAANTELGKYPTIQTEQDESLRVRSVGELIYIHSLACGRDGAVKHLLGQFDAARSCYRSAGLLAETLLMDSNIGNEDRKILEGYVDGFAARITELDEMMLQQSRSMGSNGGSSTTGSRRAGSGIIGLIGPPSASMPFGFGVLRTGNMS